MLSGTAVLLSLEISEVPQSIKDAIGAILDFNEFEIFVGWLILGLVGLIGFLGLLFLILINILLFNDIEIFLGWSIQLWSILILIGFSLGLLQIGLLFLILILLSIQVRTHNMFSRILNFERAIFQTFWKDDCCTNSLFIKLETSNIGYLFIF